MADANKNLSLDELAQTYGFAASFFNADWELKNLIQQAVANQWSVPKFQASFMATGWYRTHAAAGRQWADQVYRDPATAERSIQQQMAKLGQQASQQGITIDPARLRMLATDSLMFGLSDIENNQALAAEFKYKGPGSSQCTAATNEDQIRKAVNDYGLTISDDTIGQWDQKMLSGQFTMDNVTGLLQNMAMSKYPGLNSYLSQGMTVRDVAEPYIQSYSSILEQAPNAIQLTDPLIQRALQGTNQNPPAASGKSGLQVKAQTTGLTPVGSSSSAAPPSQPQSLYDFENALRQDPRWLNTKNAHDNLQQAGMGILRNFGLYS